MLIPITRPPASSSGPPLSPGFTGASLCRYDPGGPSSTDRAFALRIPRRTLGPSPNGFPIATTASPTWAASLDPISIAGRPCAPESRISATSSHLSRATTAPRNARPSSSSTRTSSASSITCRLVSTTPSGAISIPDPTECSRARGS